jgi:hypothetical protein
VESEANVCVDGVAKRINDDALFTFKGNEIRWAENQKM